NGTPPTAVSSSREHTRCLCRSFAMLKDDGKGSVATYATEGSRQANIAVAVKKHKFLYSHK
ncbi:MAG: hypothetical protein IIX09_08740, partial [Clostridia bacterium]|nr:hypothetical protein [Clostridia bacterium]